MDARLQRRGHSLTPHDVSPRSFQLVVARLLTRQWVCWKTKKETSRASTPSISPPRSELIPKNDFNLNRSSLSTSRTPFTPRNKYKYKRSEPKAKKRGNGKSLFRRGRERGVVSRISNNPLQVKVINRELIERMPLRRNNASFTLRSTVRKYWTAGKKVAKGCEEAREEKKKDRIGGSVDKSGLSGHLLSFVLPAIFYHPFRPSFWGGNGSGPFSSRRCIGPTH